MRIAGILLAAGRGARFGGAKLLAPIPRASHGVGAGTPLGVAAALHLYAALGNVTAVIRPGDSLLHDALAATGAEVLECPRADEGMGCSLAAAIAAAGAADGWVVALGDMPFVAPATIVAVADALRDGGEIVAPAFDGVRGHPVAFARAYGSLLQALTGDEGARTILAARQWAVRQLVVDDPGVIHDIDWPADLQR